MKTTSVCLSLFLGLFCSAPSSAQWVQVGSDSGLIYTFVRIRDNVIVSLKTDCANVYSGPSVSDSIKKCEPAGTPGWIPFGPAADEHGSSGLMFWAITYADGVNGWTAGIDLTHPIPQIRSLAAIGTNLIAGTADGGGAYRSTDNGTSWTSINDGLDLSLSNGTAHVDVLGVSGTDIFAGTDVGTYRSTNNGTTWTWAGTGLSRLGVSAFIAGRTCLFAITSMGPVFRSTNSGTDWEQITPPGTIAVIDTNLFAEHDNGDIDLSTDNGTSWKNVWSGCAAVQAMSFCASGRYLFSLSEGNSPDVCIERLRWTDCGLVPARGMNFPPGFVGTCGGGAKSIGVGGTNVFLTVAGVGNFFSTNSGADWEALSLPPGVSFPVPFAPLGTNLFIGATGVWRNSLSNALPITLTSIKAIPVSDGVTLTWTTLSESNNYGFYVQRNGVDIKFIAGQGTTLQQHSYSYTDNPSPGKYQYRLRQVDLNGSMTLSETILVDVSAPAKFALNQNYPNPFNPSTRISFSIGKEGPVSLRVYDILGQEVATLINENRKAGEYTELFDGSQMASGVYVYVLSSSEGRLTGRMMMLK
jgi:hypothetical protein